MGSSSSFAGTALSLPSSSAWTEIVDRCENALNDAGNAEFTTAEIAEWLNDFVRDYSQYFPLIKTQNITAVASTHVYNLNADFMGVLAVEYPTSQDPPEYLSRLVHTHPDFWTGTKWYDIVHRNNDTDPDEIWISHTPDGGEGMDVMYNGQHAIISDTSSISGNTTVQMQHQHLAVKFVQWQATLQLMFTEQVTPTSSSSLLMAQLSQNARRMEAGYHTAIRQALYAADGISRPARWISGSQYSRQDTLARIY